MKTFALADEGKRGYKGRREAAHFSLQNKVGGFE
jgi:hypothetical protein